MTDWPGGASVAVSLTFDVDAESGWLGSGEAYARRRRRAAPRRLPVDVVEVTPETFAMLVEAGFEYDSSFMGDDWPHFGWSIDSGGNTTPPAALYDAWEAEYLLARREGRHVTFTMHPEVIGRGQRFLQLERLVERMAGDGDVWFARLDEVAGRLKA